MLYVQANAARDTDRAMETGGYAAAESLPKWPSNAEGASKLQVCVERHLMLGGGFKYFFFSPRTSGEDEPNLTSIFFKGVGSTTNQSAIVGV